METANLDLLSWWGDADWIVRGVFLILSALSLLSWTIMVFKGMQYYRAYRLERAFDAAAAPASQTPLAYIARGLQGVDAKNREVLAGALARESRLAFESGLTMLATIGNTAPFIGLLGTVWGIMHALQGLGSAEALSMALIAGPVAEALVATAAGLFTAIPAVVGYNLLLRKLRRLFGVVDSNAVRLLFTLQKSEAY